MSRARELAAAHRRLWAMIAAAMSDDGPGLRALAADLDAPTARDTAAAGAVIVAEMLTNPDMPTRPMPVEQALDEVRQMLALTAPDQPERGR
ncbi:Uncharacterised protein [Mycobacterium tuberculosis]|nr:Uncharacterised protein [Mycobacterium tuberculosis]